MTRVLLVDDNAALRFGVDALLSATDDLRVVGHCGDGDEAVAAAVRGHAQVAVMDVSMARTDGITATGLLRAEVPSCRVLILTLTATDHLVRDARRAGASGLLLKSSPHDELVAAVRTVAAGGTAWSPWARDALRRADDAAAPD